jgi:isopentenyldiphosphate isomerase
LCDWQFKKRGVLVEKWDVYDKSGNPTGKTKTRNDVFEPGEYHLGVSVWILNRNGELLIQKRSAAKRIHPNIWAVTSGAVISGETSIQGCIREAYEEIGIQLNEDDLVLLSRHFCKDIIFDDYITFREFPIENAAFQASEVSEVKWASITEIKQLFSLGLFMLDDSKDLDIVIQYLDGQNRK